MIELSTPPEPERPDHAPPFGTLPDAPELTASAALPLYRSDFLERYRLWKGLERLKNERATGSADIETIAREEQTRADWLTPETAMDLLCADLESERIKVKHLEHNARRLGLNPDDVRAALERQRKAAEEAARVALQQKGEEAERFTGTLLAFDPGDSCGWALLRLATSGDVQARRADREREPLILDAGSFLVEAALGDPWSTGALEAVATREQMRRAISMMRAEPSPPTPELPAPARRGVRAGVKYESARSEPGAACAALIRALRPSIVACEWIYRVFPKGKKIQTSEGPIIKSGMSVAMTTGLYRAGVVGGAIRGAALAAGIPFVHLSAASWRRAIVGNYRAKDAEIARVIARVRKAPIREGVILSTSHPRDAIGVALFALASLAAPDVLAAAAPRGPKGKPAREPTGVEGEPARRGPGRPRKPVDPAALPPVKRPRGRPRKTPLDASTEAPRPSSEPASVEPPQPALPFLDPVPGSKPGNAL